MRKELLSIILPAIITGVFSGCAGTGEKKEAEQVNNDTIVADTARVDTVEKADTNVRTDTSTSLYDFALFADDGNIIISQFAALREGRGSYPYPDKWGLIDTTGKVIVDGSTTWLVPEINQQGRICVPNSAGYTAFMREGNELIGILDKNYEEYIPPTYKNLCLYGEYAVVKDDTKSGMDILHIPTKKIKGHIKDTYEIEDISEDMVRVTNDKNERCFLDLKGNVVISPAKLKDYAVISGFRDGRALVANDYEGKAGFIDRKGNTVIPQNYYFDYFDMSGTGFHNGTAVLSRGEGKWGVIDRNGNVVIPFKYSHISRDVNSGFVNFVEGYSDNDKEIFRFDKHGRKTGKYITTDSPDEWVIFTDKDTKNEGFKDSAGKEMLPAIYRNPSHFKNGYAIVYVEDEGICLINSKGEIILKGLARRNQAMLPG